MNHILAAILTVTINIPQNLTPLQSPESLRRAQEYCEAYGGIWNLYENAAQDASWFECDDPDYDPTEDCDENPSIYSPGDACYIPPVTDKAECDELDGTIDPQDGACVDEEGNVYTKS